MVETLTNLKNNKVKKTAAGQLAGSEAVERMKKWLSGLTKKRHGELPLLPRIILFSCDWHIRYHVLYPHSRSSSPHVNRVPGTISEPLLSMPRYKLLTAHLSNPFLVRTHEPLRVSLEDLHSAETKGKWWLVGAAWGGDPLVDRQDSSQTHAQSQGHNQAGNEPPSENKLLKLARKQGMNTDIRRSIFVVLMSSEVRFVPGSSSSPALFWITREAIRTSL